jgi:Tol biopolymer transport system component
VKTVTAGLPQGSRNPALSPDGTRIAVETGGGIAVLAVAALGEEALLQSFSVPALRSTYPAWASDGMRIAVSAITDPITIYN